GGERRRRTLAALETCPREVAVAHHDPARDYQLGVQRVRRPGPGARVDRVELPAVLGADAAKGVAAALVRRGEAERTRRRIALGIEGLAIAPGTIVTIDDAPQRWRVASNSVEAMVVTLELVPLAAAPTALAASSGSAAAAPDVAIGGTRLVAVELPGLDDALLAMPRISVLANGTGAGWREAALLYSLDDGASWTTAGSTAAPATLGRLIEPPAATSPWLVDRRSRMIVALDRPDMVLGDADAASLARGANLALAGAELIQFARAEPLGGGRWAISDLRRGVRGTEAAIGGQAAGDRFVLVEREAIAAIDLPVTSIGRRLRVLASGVGDGDAPVEAALNVTGISVAPPAPVRLTAREDGAGGLFLDWTRRSRAGWSWIDGIDAPLAEETEAYRVTLELGGGIERSIDTLVPRLHLAAGDRPAGRARVAVEQRGTLALSPPLRMILDGARR
ncbi:MAG: phage tail protein, partial [Sphingomonas sp.]